MLYKILKLFYSKSYFITLFSIFLHHYSPILASMSFETYFKISYGLYIVTTKSGNKMGGYIANTLFQVTATPPQFAISCNPFKSSSPLLRVKYSNSLFCALFPPFTSFSHYFSKLFFRLLFFVNLSFVCPVLNMSA